MLITATRPQLTAPRSAAAPFDQEPAPPEEALPSVEHVATMAGAWAAVGAVSSAATALVYAAAGDWAGLGFQVAVGVAGAVAGAALLGERFGGGQGGRAVGALMGLPAFFLTLPGGQTGPLAAAVTGAVVGGVWGGFAGMLVPEKRG